MKPKMLGSTLLVFAFAVGLMAWLEPSAHAAAAYAPKFTRCVSPLGAPCYTSIQAAINDSWPGDSINVLSGTYFEHITMTNQVSIYGQGWSDTVINGNYSAMQPTVYIPSGVDASTVLSGVQVTGGGVPFIGPVTLDNFGGGIAVHGSPTIVNTWVYSNTAYEGGGVYVNGGSPSLINVPAWNNIGMLGGGFFLESAVVTITSDFAGVNGTVLWNSAPYVPGLGGGGGIYIHNATATLQGLRVYWNSASNGGGIVADSNAPNKITIVLSDISWNTSEHDGGGIALYAGNCPDLQIMGNKINFNTAATWGGGIRMWGCGGLIKLNQLIGNTATTKAGGGVLVSNAWGTPSTVTLDSNWIEGNTAGTVGGGLEIDHNAQALINANVFVTNTASTGGGIDLVGTGSVMLTNNIIARNVASSYTAGGLYISGTLSTPAQVINNTIADSYPGDGIYFTDANGTLIFNNIIYGNQGYGIRRGDGSDYSVDYNDLYNNSAPGVCGPHCLSLDPKFVGSGDLFAYYHLQPTSPVYNTGSLISASANDIDGDPRVLCASMGADQIPCLRLYLPLIIK